ncbi:MAG: cupin domain-containing protein [Steroidobacteraceae bacterium]
MSKRIDVAAVATLMGSLYPPPFDEPCKQRERRRLGDAAGLTQFGVNLLRLAPGSWSSQRHWHSHEDEFVYVLEGCVTLVSDQGEEELRAGDAAGFKSGEANGHSLHNRSAAHCVLLEVGSRNETQDVTTYPDIDLRAPAGGIPAIFTHRDGVPYANVVRRSSV